MDFLTFTIPPQKNLKLVRWLLINKSKLTLLENEKVFIIALYLLKTFGLSPKILT